MEGKMRRWMLVLALFGLVMLLRVPASAQFAAASPTPRVVVFELFASPT